MCEQEIQQKLDQTRQVLTSTRLPSSKRHQIQLLLQRQNLEQQELKLKHYTELENVLKSLGKFIVIYRA